MEENKRFVRGRLKILRYFLNKLEITDLGRNQQFGCFTSLFFITIINFFT